MEFYHLSRARSALLAFCFVSAAVATAYYFHESTAFPEQVPAVAKRRPASVAKPVLSATPVQKLEALSVPAHDEAVDPNTVKLLAAAEAKLTELEKNLKWLMEQKEKFGVPPYLLEDLKNREHELAQIDNALTEQREAKLAEIAQIRSNLDAVKMRAGQESPSVDSKVESIKREIASQKQTIEHARAKLNR